MRLRWSYTVARVFGIPIKAHITLLLIVPVLRKLGFDIIATLVLGIGIFTTIALHELGHSLVALRKGCRVREILLLPIGGVAKMENIPNRPRDEFLMAIAGPAVSLILFGVLWAAGRWLPLRPIPAAGMMNYAEFLGFLNLGFVLFNLIPAFPMDGGRILRAWLTLQIGRLRATFVAATIGKAFAIILGLAGIFPGPFHLVIIAILLYFAANREYRMIEMQERASMFAPFFGAVGGSHGAHGQEVIISPPPYEKGPAEKTRLQTMRDRKGDALWRLFHRE